MRLKRSRRFLGGLNLPKLAAGAALAMVLGALAVQATVLATATSGSGLGRYAGNNPRQVFDRAANHVALEGALPPAGTADLDQAADRAPLAADPFFFAALQLGNEDIERSIGLLEESRRRNPRYRYARLMLLDRYVRAGNVDAATSEMVVLARLIPDAGDMLIGQLARLLADPATRRTAREAIGSGPALDRALEQLARDNGDPELVLQLSRGRTGTAEEAAAWRFLAVDALVDRGQVARAYELWRNFYNAAPRAERPPVYDPQFQGLPGTAPFNWELVTSEVGAAEPRRGGGLDVSYFGRQSGPLARQLLLLGPGRYRLRFRVEGSAPGTGSRLVWRVGCNRATTALLEVPMREINYAPKVLGGEFVVPATGCDSQWLRLDGDAAEFPTTQTVEITGLAIEPRGENS